MPSPNPITGVPIDMAPSEALGLVLPYVLSQQKMGKDEISKITESAVKLADTHHQVYIEQQARERRLLNENKQSVNMPTLLDTVPEDHTTEQSVEQRFPEILASTPSSESSDAPPALYPWGIMPPKVWNVFFKSTKSDEESVFEVQENLDTIYSSLQYDVQEGTLSRENLTKIGKAMHVIVLAYLMSFSPGQGKSFIIQLQEEELETQELDKIHKSQNFKRHPGWDC